MRFDVRRAELYHAAAFIALLVSGTRPAVAYRDAEHLARHRVLDSTSQSFSYLASDSPSPRAVRWPMCRCPSCERAHHHFHELASIHGMQADDALARLPADELAARLVVRAD